MYRKRPYATDLTDGFDVWEDWPADTTSAADSRLAALLRRPEIDDTARAPQPRLPTVQPASPVNPPALPAERSPAPAPHGAAAAPSTPTDGEPADAAKPRRHPARMAALALAALLALGAGGWYGHYWWTTGRYLVVTDDAYVGAKNATLAAKITGYVSEVAVDDNAHVREGDVIARIDDGDYQLAAQTARDNLATQQATVDRIGKQVAAQEAAVDQAKAQLASAQAGATRAGLELKRQQELAARDYASRQTLEQAQASRDQANAAVQASQAALEAAQANVDVLKAQQVEATGTLKQFQTALAKAERDLSFTVIRAPFDGVIGNRAMQVGDLVQPGTRLASLVPLDAVYVDANFKETQLADLHRGQPVSIAVDAYSSHKLDGTVVSVAPASGSVFSLLPPDNATGNFTKIVQRVPVRIAVPPAVAEQGLLRPGMSVVVRVDTRPGALAKLDGTAVAARTGSSRVR
jgi:membrane fusion protein, multidrug efflux system